MRRFFRLLALCVAVLLAVGLAGLWGVYRAAQQVPEFYEQALQLKPAVQAEAGDQLEQRVLDLHNDARNEGHWEAVFSDAQINGWLAVDLTEKFSRALPDGVRDPRVVIEPDLARIACVYDGRKMSSVVSVQLEIHLTDRPNELAVRVCQARAGVLPLPLKEFLDQIARAARDAEVPLRWAQTDGDPVALVNLPTHYPEFKERRLLLEVIELREGEVFLAGRTEGEGETQESSATERAAADQSDRKRNVQR